MSVEGGMAVESIKHLDVIKERLINPQEVRTEVFKELMSLQESDDYYEAHWDADRAICSFLIYLGYGDIVEAWDGVGKYYN